MGNKRYALRWLYQGVRACVAAGIETAIAPSARCVGEPVIREGTQSQRRRIQPTHPGLDGNVGGLVESSQHDCGQPSVDFLVDDPEREGLASPRTITCSAHMIESPPGVIESNHEVVF